MEDLSLITEPAITLNKVNLSIGNHPILTDITFDVPAANIVVLYGANGAGKSSLLKLLAGLQNGAKMSGEGKVLNYPIWPRQSSARSQIAYMPQYGGLYEELSVKENMQFRTRMLGLQDSHQVISKTVEKHGLHPVFTQIVGHLSGGWKQRVAFAMSLLAQPKLILLDEPSAGVDLEAKSKLWEKIEQEKKLGATIFISSHDSDEAKRADSLLSLHNGEINFQGKPEDLCTSLKLKSAHYVYQIEDEHEVVYKKLSAQFSTLVFSEKKTALCRFVWKEENSNIEIPYQLKAHELTLEDGLRALLILSKQKTQK
jgi:ABC-2 type transport system ATP-binding protein